MANSSIQKIIEYLHFLKQSYLSSYVSYNQVLIVALFVWGATSLILSFGVRFDFAIPASLRETMPYVALVGTLLKLLIFFALGAHKANWRYVGIGEIKTLMWVSVISSCAIYAFSFLDRNWIIPRGVIIIDCVLFFLGSCAIRLSGRILRERVLNVYERHKNPQQSSIIIGAGDGGEMLLREIRRNKTSKYRVMAFFDDNALKKGQYIHGLKIIGDIECVPEYVRFNSVEVALIAIPSANRRQMNRIYSILEPLDISIKTLPPVLEYVEGENLTTRLRDININDLLGREEIHVERARINDSLMDRTVLITGAGGSIGSELARQVLKASPRILLLLEKNENTLFHIHRKLSLNKELCQRTKVIPLLCDLRDRNPVSSLMSHYRPEIVLHAAAHKHVHMQELNPTECFRNNIGGIRNIVELSHDVGVEKFVLISTDKAVNPTSIMGATKRLCELYCQAYAKKSSTSFLSVRFGNVLGSEGSVVPLFLEQINNGGPVTVTHPDVKRYFMTIPEAVALVLQASVIGETGQIMMLDMGEPIKILDLACQLMRMAGKSPTQIPIEFIGLKRGEKIFEKLSCDTESCVYTEHPKVHLYRSEFPYDPEQFTSTVNTWVSTVFSNGSDDKIRDMIKQLVVEYRPEAPETATESLGETCGHQHSA